MSRPRREAWSFLCVLKCSVSSPIRSLRIAIWTSGEPVSVSWVRKRSIRVVFLAVASTACVTPLVFSGPLLSVYCEITMNERCEEIWLADFLPVRRTLNSFDSSIKESLWRHRKRSLHQFQHRGGGDGGVSVKLRQLIEEFERRKSVERRDSPFRFLVAVPRAPFPKPFDNPR